MGRFPGRLPERQRDDALSGLGAQRLDARLRALRNQRPFKLRDRAEDLEGKHALGRRSIDGVAQRAKTARSPPGAR